MSPERAAGYFLEFGKYKGRRLDEVARLPGGAHYLDWLVGQDWLRERARETIAFFLDARDDAAGKDGER